MPHHTSATSMLPYPSLIRTFVSMQSIGISIGLFGLMVAAICGPVASWQYQDETQRHTIIDHGLDVAVTVVAVERRSQLRYKRAREDPFAEVGEYENPEGVTLVTEHRISEYAAREVRSALASGRPVEVAGKWHAEIPDRVVVPTWEVSYDRWPVFAGIAAFGGALLVIGMLSAMAFASKVRHATPVRGNSMPGYVTFTSPGGLARDLGTRRRVRRRDPVMLMFDSGRVILAQSVYSPDVEESIAATLPAPR